MDFGQAPPPHRSAGSDHRLEKLKRCFELGELITASLDLDVVLERIMTTTRQALEAETCSLLLTESPDGEGRLVFTVAQGPVSHLLPKGRMLPRGQGLAGWVLEHGQALLVPDVYADPRFNPGVDRRTGYRTRTMLCAPLAVKGRIIGVAQLINRLDATPFTPEDLEFFSLLCVQAAIAIDNARLHQAMLEKQRMEFDMELAASIQRGFLPKTPPPMPGLETAAVNIPCDSTGGDYYDYIPLSNDRVLIAVGDVSGHGIPAALLMASVRAYLRARALHEETLDALARDVNTLLCQDTGDTGNFMTLFLLLLHPPTRTLRFLRAGHDPAVIVDAESKRTLRLSPPGIPLGIESGQRFPQDGPVSLEPGQILYLGTDGIWETFDPQGAMYGRKRLEEVVAANVTRSATEIVDAVLADVASFRQGTRQEDDVTLLVIKSLE